MTGRSKASAMAEMFGGSIGAFTETVAPPPPALAESVMSSSKEGSLERGIP